MRKDFLWPPFSVFNTAQTEWQEKKQYWFNKGINSAKGRNKGLLGSSNIMSSIGSGTSIFDPVLCELFYNWFCPKGGLILDCFAGGSVRGLMAYFSDRNYIGVDLRKEQTEENKKQLNNILESENDIENKYLPIWHPGDSLNIDKICKGVEADFLFSCPPYFNLEVYSNDPNDLSNMDYNNFVKNYTQIIKKSCSLLKNNSFACFIVSQVRKKDKIGEYIGFVTDTVKAFEDSGLKYYNEAILVNVAGTLPLRAGRAFKATRKLGKQHQNILIFVKGDPRKAVARIGEINFLDETKNNQEEYYEEL